MLRCAMDSPVLDVSVVETIRSLGEPGEPDVFVEIARLFLADVPEHLALLTSAIAAGDAAAVWPVAHRLRGSALEIGAIRMAPLCGAIELAARAGSLEHAAGQAALLAREFVATRAALEQFDQEIP